MAYPVIDTFSDANGTLLAGAGVVVNGSFETDRLSASGSKMKANAGPSSIASYGQLEIFNGCVYAKTAGIGPAPMVYVDNAGSVNTEQITGAFRFYTATNQTYIALTLHNYYQLRYYLASTGNYTANRWYIVDSLASATPIASFIPPAPLSFGSVGTYVDHVISYKLIGNQPATVGYTVEVIVDGVTLGWAPNFTSAYAVGNQLQIGWMLSGTSVATPGSETGIHLNTFAVGTGSTSATGAALAGPAVVGNGIATPVNYTVKGLVGGDDAGVMKLSLTPNGGTLGASATFALSDGAGGTFSGPNVASNVLTIASGSGEGYFSYTPSGAGSKTITAVGGAAAASFANATLPVVSSNRLIILDGDSRTANRDGNSSTVIAANNTIRWPTLLQKRLKTSAAVYNFAGSGQAVTDQIADFATEIQPVIQTAIAAGATVYFVQWGAGNGVSGISSANTSLTPAQVGQTIAGQIASLCNLAKALGAKPIVFTDARRTNNLSLPYGFATWQGVRDEANFNLAVDACNTVIRDNWKQYASGIVDWGSDERNLTPLYTGGIFEDGTHLNPFNANTDTHDKAAGATDLAATVFAIFRSLELGASASSGGGSFVFGG